MGDTTTVPSATRSRWTSIALGLWVLLALAVAVKTTANPGVKSVFPKNATHALDWWKGESLYRYTPGLGHFPYLPTHAILLTPFAVLGLAAGGILWTWLNMAVYVIGLRRLIADVLGEPARRREATYLFLAMIGAIRGIWNAQGNAIIIGLFMLAAAALVRRRWWLAAVLMTIPVHMKTWPIAMALLLVLIFPRPMLWRFAVALAAGLLLPFATQKPSVVLWQYHNWLDYMLRISESGGNYRDLRSLLHEFRIPPSPRLWLVFQMMTGLAIAAWCLWIRPKLADRDKVLMLALAAGAAWCMVFGVATEYNTVVVLAPAACWILITSFQDRRGRLLGLACFSVPLVLGAGAVERELVKITRAALLTIPVGSLLCLAWLVRYGARTIEASAFTPPAGKAEPPAVAGCARSPQIESQIAAADGHASPDPRSQ
jgi:hypothetical protein